MIGYVILSVILVHCHLDEQESFVVHVKNVTFCVLFLCIFSFKVFCGDISDLLYDSVKRIFLLINSVGFCVVLAQFLLPMLRCVKFHPFFSLSLWLSFSIFFRA